MTYLALRLHDDPGQALDGHLHAALAWLDEQRRSRRRVLVHCHAGVSRSVSIVVAYLMHHHALQPRDSGKAGAGSGEAGGAGTTAGVLGVMAALKLVRRVRPVANPNPGFLCQLLEWEKRRQVGSSVLRVFAGAAGYSCLLCFCCCRLRQQRRGCT